MLGELSYAEEPPYIKNIVSGLTKIDLTRKGYAVGLIRKNSTGRYDLLGVTNNESIVHDTIVDTYKRNEDLLPPILRTITEAISTQTLPTQFEKFRQELNDMTSVLASDGKTKLRTVKRLLLRPKTKDIHELHGIWVLDRRRQGTFIDAHGRWATHVPVRNGILTAGHHQPRH